MPLHVPNHFRVRVGRMASRDSAGNNGAFFVPNKCAPVSLRSIHLRCIASDGTGAPEGDPIGDWEHVSVSLPTRCPTWEEMCFIKALFWDADDCVMQLHPAASEYVNNHPYCLHMWRPKQAQIPLPPSILVGYKGLTPAQANALADIGHE